MGLLFATIYDPFMRRTERACLVEWRRALLEPLRGSVLEIGAGTGANLAHYPDTVERLVLSDTDEHMLSRLERTAVAARGSLAGREASVQIVRSSADALPFADETFDAVVSTLVLCSVPDVARTLTEVRRVLKPEGRLVFLEHVMADDPGRRRWQRRLAPVWSRLAGNCHLTRETDRAIAAAGFSIESVTRESMRKAMPVVRPTIRGTATKHRASA